MNSDVSKRVAMALCIGLLCSSFSPHAPAAPAEDSALEQLQMAETDARESKKESDKKPPREVRKAEPDTDKSAKKNPKKAP
jgi:hypothetical protein